MNEQKKNPKDNKKFDNVVKSLANADRPAEEAAVGAAPAAEETGRGGDRDSRGPKGKRPRKPAPARSAEASEYLEKVVAINRITKVTKGGKKLSFSALVVVGDTKGRVGYSLDKAGEVATAIQKALSAAKKSMVYIPLHETTIPHQINGVWAGSLVMLKPASKGTGVIAAGPVRAVCDAAGIRDILTKCHRSNNPINVVKATFDGLMRLKAYNKIVNQEEVKNATA